MSIEEKILPLLKKINLPIIVWNGNILLFHVSDVLKFMDFCDEYKINILGMDGFRILNDKIQPDLKYIYDGKTTNINRNFFQKDLQKNYTEMQNLYFEFVLEEVTKGK